MEITSYFITFCIAQTLLQLAIHAMQLYEYYENEDTSTSSSDSYDRSPKDE